MSYLIVIGLVVMAGLGALWQTAEAALEREQKARAVAEASVKGYADSLTQCRAEIAEKNRIITGIQGLDERRLRLCVTRPATDPCCQPPPAPPAEDRCKP